jgi:Domain of unknown function (DUF4115)
MGARGSFLKARTMSKRSSVRSKKHPPDPNPPAEEKSASQKKPYVFTRAFARLLGVDEEQAVAGYLAATSPGEPNPTLRPPPYANAPSDSKPGGSIPQTGVENRKVTQIPNPSSIKFPPVGEIQSPFMKPVRAQGESDRGNSLPDAKAPWESRLGQPIRQTGDENRKVTEIANPPNMKLPPVGEIQTRFTKSVPEKGRGNRATGLPHANAPSGSSSGQPITQTGGSEIRRGTEIANPPNMKLPPAGEIQARFTKSVPAQGEGNRATSLPGAKAPWESSPGRPVNPTGGENRNVTEIPNPNMKFPPVGEGRAQVTKSAPAEGGSNRATSLPGAKAPWESSPGRPINPTGGENRKVTEIPNPPNMKFPPVAEIPARVTKSVPTQGESNRADSLPQLNVPSEPSIGQTLSQAGGENRKVTEISNTSNMKVPSVDGIQVQVMESAPAEEESNRATSLPPAKAPSESGQGRPITPTGVETEIANSSNIQFPPVGGIQARATRSAPAKAEGNWPASLAEAKAPSEPGTGGPLIQAGAENRKITGISNPSIVKLPSIEEIRSRVMKFAAAQANSERVTNLSWETFSILLLVVALVLAGWGFYTRESDTRVKHLVPAGSTSNVSILPPAWVASSKGTKAPPSFEIRIKAHKNVRVLIKADGKKVTEETLSDGAERSVRATNQVIVKTGNLGALDLEFNGRRLPSQGAHGEVKTLEFGPSGLEVIISNPPTRIKPGE